MGRKKVWTLEDTGSDESMIELRIQFSTDGVPKAKDETDPRHCWNSGVVGVVPNAARGIERTTPQEFDSLPGLIAKIQTALTGNGITLHHWSWTRRLYSRSLDPR